MNLTVGGSDQSPALKCTYRSVTPEVEVAVTQRKSPDGQRRGDRHCLDTTAFGGPAQVCAKITPRRSSETPASTEASVVRFADDKSFDVDVRCTSAAVDRPTLPEQTQCWDRMTAVATAFVKEAQVPATNPDSAIPTYPNFPPD